MQSFFDLQVKSKQSPEEYTQSIPNPIKRAMIEDLFICAEKIINIARSDTFPPPERPIIRINPTEHHFAEGMDGLIEISDGFIQLCLSMPSPPLNELIEKSPSDQEIPSIIPNGLFSWTIAHEYWHGIRRHNTVLDCTENNNQTLRAVEIDADLCAAASLYRWAQLEMQKHYTDITIRKVVFLSLFWAIRSLPENKEESTHPSNMERIYHIYAKLTHLRKNKKNPSDPSLRTDESKGNVIPLFELMIRAEKLYKSKNPRASGDMIEFMKSFIHQKGWTGFTEKWEDIRTLVSVTSGTKA